MTDLHIKFSNLEKFHKLIQYFENFKDTDKIDIIVIGGDILDSHERVSIVLMNTALKLFKTLSKLAPLYIIIGNHDYINNQQFLTTNHWMNALKEWKNIVIVDTPIIFQSFLFVPYVFPGKFKKCLNEIDLSSIICIFSHQEFLDCQMGMIKSVQGDNWESNLPLVISGHIHDRQKVNSNILYPGSISKGKIFKYFFSDNPKDGPKGHNPLDDPKGHNPLDGPSGHNSLIDEVAINLNFMSPKIKKINLDDEIKHDDLNGIDKIIVEGNVEKISVFKKTDIFRTNQEKIKFVIHSDEIIEESNFETDFKKNLENLVNQENDSELKKDFLNLFL